jgi:amidohydrolase/IAA-amino acid hydrolase
MLLQGSLRAVQKAVYDEVAAKMLALTNTLEKQYGAKLDLDFSAYYPSLLNDPAIHEKLHPVQHQLFGDANVIESLAYLVGEDFSFYSRKMPAQFYFLGAKTDQNESFFLHHPQVTFNEDCIKYGAPLLAKSALQLLSDHSRSK